MKFVVLFLIFCFQACVAFASEKKAEPLPQVRFFQSLAVDENRIMNADSEPQNWLSHGRTYSEQRYSPLDEINRSNVKKLGLAWAYKTGTKRGLEATPIVINGIIYTTGSWSKVYAVDARTGAEIWTFDPKVPGEAGRNACCDVVNRGLAIWQGKLYLGTIDGRLIALDARDGTPVWEVVTVDQSKPYTITGAPRVVKGKVIIGNGGAEYGVRGYFSAYDAESGKMLWRFYTVPGHPDFPLENPALKKARQSWPEDSLWVAGLGGTVWDSFAYDPELNLLYVGVGNGANFNRAARSPGGGDNLYLSSILAVNPDNGELKWHYQTTPGESWDFTATQHMILADIEISGKTRQVLMQAPKNGFFYVIDRATGELISAKNYTPMNWASHVDLETGRPVETGKGDWSEEMALVMPGPAGGHNWHPMSYSPDTGLVYIPTIEMVYPFIPDTEYEYLPGHWNTGEDREALGRMADSAFTAFKFCSPNQLTAWDPVRQEKVWQNRFETVTNGGVLSTAGGLVFHGNGTGDFSAYADDTGDLLWKMRAPTAVMAAPVTYKVDGDQYILVMAGAGGIFGMNFDSLDYENDGTMLAFKLNGSASMPARIMKEGKVDASLKEVSLSYEGMSDEEIDEGWSLYNLNCLVCHGAAAKSSGLLPDLRHSSKETHEAWAAIVIGGMLKDRGMASFADVLTIEQAEKIHGYVVRQAIKQPGIMQQIVDTVSPHVCIPPTWVAK
ncbi:MAG: PQQ-dependent dehydrogenase (methanol/ethanol family) [Candidatus Azotimanducaceae bacterium]|jgi:PQQ-dependent dehydrogenase (methanol/ethanol family)